MKLERVGLPEDTLCVVRCAVASAGDASRIARAFAELLSASEGDLGRDQGGTRGGKKGGIEAPVAFGSLTFTPKGEASVVLRESEAAALQSALQR